MVDVVNSSTASAVILLAGGGANANGPAQQPDIISEAVQSGAPDTPQAPYVSPYISVNYDYDKAVLQIRDADTGDVQEQFPTNSRLAQIRRAQAQLEQARLAEDAQLSAPETGSSNASASAQAQQAQNNQASSDIIAVQEVTSAPPANSTNFSPQIAVAALSAASQSGATSSANVSVQV